MRACVSVYVCVWICAYILRYDCGCFVISRTQEDASRDLHYNLSTLLLGSGCGDLMCIGSLGGLPVAGAYSVNHMDEVTPLGLTFSVLRPFNGLVAPLASFENAKEPQWPEDTKRKIVLLASTHTDTIGPDHAEFTGPLAVWVHLLSMKGYEPKVVCYVHNGK